MRLVFLLASVTATMAAGADNRDGYANSFSYGNGQGYGYSGSFGGGGSGASGSPGGPVPPNYSQYNFNNLFDIFQKFNQELTAANNKKSVYAYSITNANSNSKVQARSSITYTKKGLQAQQNSIFSGASGFPHGYPGGYQGGGGYGGGFSSFNGQGPSNHGSNGGGYGFNSFGGAAASASLGPGGSHQTAQVYPENPTIPNVDTRFGDSSSGGSPDASSYGVFTSSQSFSSDVDGKPTNYHQASTTINDNGKVTTYTVHNP